MIALIIAAAALAAPTTTFHQGRLLDGLGQPINGSVTVNFDLHTDDTTLASEWSEQHTLQLDNGYYAVVLGNSTPLTAELLAAHESLWVGITTTSGTSLGRTALQSAPYSIAAAGAETLTRSDCNAGDVLRFNGTSWDCAPDETGSGITYERWGRTSCPANASPVYVGYMAGGRHSDGGRLTNYHCLNNVPQYIDSTTANENGGLMWIVEYRTAGYGVNSLDGVSGQKARCAVCEVPTDSQQIVIPGTGTCPSGWTEAYDGFLFGAYYQHANSESVCVDRNAEGYTAGAADGDEYSLIYPIEFQSYDGASPYTHDRELSCVVCTK